jgi:hypothetical protein
MANLYGPRIVTDGLVFSVDAGNKKSYPGSGTTWYDLSGNNNNGTLQNGTALNSSNVGSFSFDNSNDYVSIPYNSIFNVTTQLTIEALVRFSGNSDDFIFEKANVNTQYSLFSHSSDIVFRTHHSNGLHTQNPQKSSVGVVNGQWHHIVGSWDGSVKRIYVDGVLKNSVSRSGNLATRTTGSSIGRFGGTSSGYFFGGNIAKVSIYSKGLSASEVLQNYNALKGRFGL